MNLTHTMNEVGNLYEEKVLIPKDTFKLQTEKKPKQAEANPKAFISKPSGPAEADGVNADIIDPKTAKDNNFYEPKKFSQNCEKTETETINNFMNKSIFDKLYEDVMSDRMDDVESNDLEALGLPGEEPAVSEEGQVTITLDKELAQKLHDVLMSVLEGEAEAEGEAEGEAEAESEDEDELQDAGDDAQEDEQALGEATHLEELPASKGATLQSKNNKVGDVTSSLKSSGEGDGKVSGEVDGKGKDLPDSKGATLQSKNNKVHSKTSKVGAYLAGLK